MEKVQSGGVPEQVRVLNVLNMFENGDMGDPKANPRTMRVLPLMCKTVLDIRRLNRKLLDRNKLLERKVEWLAKNNCPGCLDGICDDCDGSKAID